MQYFTPYTKLSKILEKEEVIYIISILKNTFCPLDKESFWTFSLLNCVTMRFDVIHGFSMLALLKVWAVYFFVLLGCTSFFFLSQIP